MVSVSESDNADETTEDDDKKPSLEGTGSVKDAAQSILRKQSSTLAWSRMKGKQHAAIATNSFCDMPSAAHDTSDDVEFSRRFLASSHCHLTQARRQSHDSIVATGDQVGGPVKG